MPHQSELTEPRPGSDNNVVLHDLYNFAPDNLGWVGIVPTSTFLEKMVLHEVVQVVSPAQDRAPDQRAESHYSFLVGLHWNLRPWIRPSGRPLPSCTALLSTTHSTPQTHQTHRNVISLWSSVGVRGNETPNWRVDKLQKIIGQGLCMCNSTRLARPNT